MTIYRFRIEKFMEIFSEISGYKEGLYTYDVAESAAKFISEQYEDGSSENLFSEDARNWCVGKLVTVFNMTIDEARAAFEELDKED